MNYLFSLLIGLIVGIGGFQFFAPAVQQTLGAEPRVFLVSQGGTGWANIQSSAIPYGNGTSRLSTTTQGTSGYVLSWSDGIPKWVATTTSSGDGIGNWFTPQTYGNSTSSVIAFTAGLISQSSTTIPVLGSGLVGANGGLLYPRTHDCGDS